MASRRKKTRGTTDEEETGQDQFGDGGYSPERMESSGSDSLSDDDNEEEDDQDFVPLENLNVEFEAQMPNEEYDVMGIKSLLDQVFLRTSMDLLTLAGKIASQSHVGSVLKQYVDGMEEADDDEDEDDETPVFGVTSCINLNSLKDTLYTQLRNHFSKKFESDVSTCAKLNGILDDSSNTIGLIINERFVNIPAQVAVPSFDSLCKDMKKANQKGDNFNFTHYLMIAKKYRLPPVDKLGKRKHSKAQVTDQEIYSNGEEEFFSEGAIFRATYSVAAERDTAVSNRWDGEIEDQYEPLREVMIIDANSMTEIIDKIRQALNQPTVQP